MPPDPPPTAEERAEKVLCECKRFPLTPAQSHGPDCPVYSNTQLVYEVEQAIMAAEAKAAQQARREERERVWGIILNAVEEHGEYLPDRLEAIRDEDLRRG